MPTAPALPCARGREEQKQKEECSAKQGPELRGEACGQAPGPRHKQLQGCRRRQGTGFCLSSSASSSFSKSCSKTYKAGPMLGLSQTSRVVRRAGPGSPRGRRRQRVGWAISSQRRVLVPSPLARGPQKGGQGRRQHESLEQPPAREDRRWQHSEQGDTSSSGPSQAEPAPPWPRWGLRLEPGDSRFWLEPHGGREQSKGATQEMGGQEGRHT